MKNMRGLGLLLAMGVMFTACSKDPVGNLTAEESRIYITDHDAAVNFSQFKTYSISDSVTVINDGQASKQTTQVDIAFINAIKTQMQAKGYTQVSRSANPDLGINVSRIYNTSTGVISYNNYYNNFYGGFYDPFYWGYGGFGYYNPYSFATYTIREGALSIDMLDLKNAKANNRISIVWTGLIRGSGIFNSATADTQIKALFDQSTYIKAQ